jgi:signal transduction histidine kinase
LKIEVGVSKRELTLSSLLIWTSIGSDDNGPGVDDPEKIFEPFFSTKRQGMGIGLAVSRSIVEAHEGQLWSENNPDFGARFTLKLSLAQRFQ